MEFNYYTSEESSTIEISQSHITNNKDKAWVLASEKLLDKENMILANTI
jgi:hypothetical protein